MKRGLNTLPIGRITANDIDEALSIEEEMRKARSNKEPIKATAKITYNDRKDGVLPQHDIRTDRFEIAMLATDKIHASQAAKRQKEDFPVMVDENGNTIDPNNLSDNK